jgi:RimJ/RimL family protein N-acetyltransferase
MAQPGDKLLDSVVKLQLPLKMNPVTLIGQTIKLVPLDIARDAASLYRMLNGDPITFKGKTFPAYDANELIWKNFDYGPFDSLKAFEDYLKMFVSQDQNLLFCIRDIETDTALGFLGLFDNDPANLKVVINYVTASPVIWHTISTVEMEYLLLKHAFDLGYRRVEVFAFTFNIRSNRFHMSLGNSFEGRRMYSYVCKGNTYDINVMSMVDYEWKNQAKAMLETRIRNAVQSNPRL